MPWPKSETYYNFVSVYGSPWEKTDKTTAGCYQIDNQKAKSYVGQTTHISYRVQSHLQGHTKTVKPFLASIRNSDAKLSVYPINRNIIVKVSEINRTCYFDIAIFLNLFEQYLIIIKNPSINKLFITIRGGSEMQNWIKKQVFS